MKNNSFIDALNNRILVLDGGMGTSIKKYNLKLENHNYDYLNITNPKVIYEIHRSFLEVGSDIIETNTLNSTSICQKQYNLEEKVYEMNYNSARLAKSIAKKFSEKDSSKPRFVAGAIGPTIKISVQNPKESYEVSFEELFNAYKEQATALIDGGVDLFLIETVININNAKAAVIAVEEALREKNLALPILVSATLTKKSNRTIGGLKLLDFTKSIESENLIGIGLNCSFGYDELFNEIVKLSESDKRFIIVYPNAGIPNDKGEYSETPHKLAQFMKRLIDKDAVNIIGGCCGTTPKHIAAIEEVVKLK